MTFRMRNLWKNDDKSCSNGYDVSSDV